MRRWSADRHARSRVSSIASMAEKTLNVVRDLALLLRPSMLDDFGLVPALNWHAREMSKRTGLNVRIAADETSDDLPDEHKTCIYRVVQEALNNSRAARQRAQPAGDREERRRPRRLLRAGRRQRFRQALRARAGTARHGRTRSPAGRRVAHRFAAGTRHHDLGRAAAAGDCPAAKHYMPPIRILLADDHTMVRDGLRALLERQPDMTVVAEAADGRECIAAGREALARRRDDGYRDAEDERHRSHAPHSGGQSRDRRRDPQHASGRELRAAVAEGRREGLSAEGFAARGRSGSDSLRAQAAGRS